MPTKTLTWLPNQPNSRVQNGQTRSFSYRSGDDNGWSWMTVNAIRFNCSGIESNNSNYSGTIKLYFESRGYSSGYFVRGTFGGDGNEVTDLTGELTKTADMNLVPEHELILLMPNGTSGKHLVQIGEDARIDFEIDYTDTRTPCTAPTVSIDTTTGIITITGGAGSAYNAFAGYGISWKTKQTGGEYGDWTEDVVLTASTPGATYQASVPTGSARTFRVRTYGEGGVGLASEYAETTEWTSNSGTITPEILTAYGATTPSAYPVIRLIIDPDPDGDSMTLYRKVDSGNYESVESGLTPVDPIGYADDGIGPLADGTHTIEYKIEDSGGVTGGVASVTINVETPTYGRTVSTGSVISSDTVSHADEITQLRRIANQQRVFHGLTEKNWATEIGRFSTWKAVMEEIEASIDAVRASIGLTAVTWTTVPSYPAAVVVNEIRTHLNDI